MKKSLRTSLYILPFLIVSVLLAMTRMPWIDEPWFAGGASALLVEGDVLDLGFCMWSDKPHYFYLNALFSSLQAIWYTLTSFNLVSGRLLSVIASVLVLFLLNDITASLGFDFKWRKISIVLISGNYYFLLNATQIRPEAFAILCITASLAAYLNWQRHPKRLRWLIAANLAAALAVLFHLQSGFTAIFMLLCLLLLDARTLSARHLVSLGIYYTSLVLLFGLHYFTHLEQWQDYIPNLFDNNLKNHGGGFLTAVQHYTGTGQWEKLFIHASTVLLVAAGLAVYWKRSGINRHAKASIFYALGGYLSWAMTTTFIGDYHSVWLIIAFFLLATFSLETLFSNSLPPQKILSLCLLTLLCFYSAYGVYYTAGVITGNPMKNLYEKEMKSLDSSHDLSSATVAGPRDIMPYFNYSREVLCWEAHHGEPDYYFTYTRDTEGEQKMSLNGYQQIERGTTFTLYSKIEPPENIAIDVHQNPSPSP